MLGLVATRVLALFSPGPPNDIYLFSGRARGLNLVGTCTARLNFLRSSNEIGNSLERSCDVRAFLFNVLSMFGVSNWPHIIKQPLFDLFAKTLHKVHIFWQANTRIATYLTSGSGRCHSRITLPGGRSRNSGLHHEMAARCCDALLQDRRRRLAVHSLDVDVERTALVVGECGGIPDDVGRLGKGLII